MQNLLETLNKEQLLAATTTEGHIRVIAGAGTGKTRTLTARYAYLVSELGISPANILTLTFTNRAANEMKDRIRKALGDADLGTIGTVHSFCTRFLKEEIHALNFPKNFIILDTEDEKEILGRIFADMKITLRDTTMQRTIDQVLEGKKMELGYVPLLIKTSGEELRQKISQESDRDSQIFYRYLSEQKKSFALDFNDLINLALYILENFEAVRAKWQERIEYVLIDEFQDMSEKQYKVAQILSALHQNLFIVGDSDQTIYTWRDAHVKLFLDFDKTFPDAKTILLSDNYRSSPQILAASNELISHNSVRYPKTLRALRENGPKPLYFHAKNSREESEWIVQKISELKALGHALKDIAVLYRSHFLSRGIEETFMRHKVPFRILSGISFYERREIKDAVAYLRMIDTQDNLAFLRSIRTPARKIGKQKIAFLEEYAQANRISLYEALRENLSSKIFKGTGAERYVSAIETVKQDYGQNNLSDILDKILELSGYAEFAKMDADQDRLDNLAEFRRMVEAAAKDPDETLQTFLSKIALYSNLDRDNREDAVKMLSIHAAKGLEFPSVFIIGLSEGLFPSDRIETVEEMEEERRIAYVAFTRAKDNLFLSENEGEGSANTSLYPSRFLFDAGESNLEFVRPLPADIRSSALEKIRQSEEHLDILSDLFFVGDRVRHSVFGEGTILDVDAKNSCYRIQFDSLATVRSLQFTAKLERLP